MQTGIDISWEGIASLVAIASSLYGLYNIGRARGKQDGKIHEMEKDMVELKANVDNKFREFSDRLTRMEDRLYQNILTSTRLIRKEIRNSVKGVAEDENAE